MQRFKFIREIKSLAEDMAEDMARDFGALVRKFKDTRFLPPKKIKLKKVSRIRGDRRQENVLFFQRLMKNPRSLGAIVPSSKKLGAFMCRHVDCAEGEYVLEVGAGTGSFTQALLKSGIRLDQLIIIELDGELVAFLKERFPQATIIQGSAADLISLLPEGVAGRIRTIVSGIPMVNLSKSLQKEIIESCFSVTLPGALMLQFTYRPIVPFPAKKFNLKAKHLGTVYLNFPPATVWSFKKLAE